MVAVKIGAPQSHEGLTLFPLLAPNGEGRGGPDAGAGDGGLWTLLADARAAGSLEVTEVGDGRVGELVAINRGPSPVLILDGEQLVGARQNRTTGRTILVAAASETRIPVSCMEQGRWHAVSRTAEIKRAINSDEYNFEGVQFIRQQSALNPDSFPP